MHFHIAVFFKIYQVRSKIAICHLHHLFQIIETHLLIHHKNTHHAQPDATFKYFIQILYWVFQPLIILMKLPLMLLPVVLQPHDHTVHDVQYSETHGPKKQAMPGQP